MSLRKIPKIFIRSQVRARAYKSALGDSWHGFVCGFLLGHWEMPFDEARIEFALPTKIVSPTGLESITEQLDLLFGAAHEVAGFSNTKVIGIFAAYDAYLRIGQNQLIGYFCDFAGHRGLSYFLQFPTDGGETIWGVGVYNAQWFPHDAFSYQMLTRRASDKPYDNPRRVHRLWSRLSTAQLLESAKVNRRPVYVWRQEFSCERLKLIRQIWWLKNQLCHGSEELGNFARIQLSGSEDLMLRSSFDGIIDGRNAEIELKVISLKLWFASEVYRSALAHTEKRYTQSDEISLLLHRDENSFNRKLRKYHSILAGEASAKFTSLLGMPAAFDCRICQLPDPERVVDYFRWRMADAHRNCLNSHCYWMLRKQGLKAGEAAKRLLGMSVEDKNELLFQNGINYNDLPAWQKRGIAFYWEVTPKEGCNPLTGKVVVSRRQKIKVDYEIVGQYCFDRFLLDLIAPQLFQRQQAILGDEQKGQYRCDRNQIPVRLEKIISGGQTGADRAGLDAALKVNIPIGGWCPAGRRAEDGVIPAYYALEETPSRNYAVRTRRNVRDSDGTLVLNLGELDGGTKKTFDYAAKIGKPCLIVQLDDTKHPRPAAIKKWLLRHTIRTLNIAGPRESKRPGIYQKSFSLLDKLFRQSVGLPTPVHQKTRRKS